MLWNLGLFFEVHEVLEHVWYSAEGNMKATLQALIRAAGVYIKREYGFNDSADRIAAKAIPVLEGKPRYSGSYFKAETLTSALKSPRESYRRYSVRPIVAVPIRSRQETSALPTPKTTDSANYS